MQLIASAISYLVMNLVNAKKLEITLLGLFCWAVILWQGQGNIVFCGDGVYTEGEKVSVFLTVEKTNVSSVCPIPASAISFLFLSVGGHKPVLRCTVPFDCLNSTAHTTPPKCLKNCQCGCQRDNGTHIRFRMNFTATAANGIHIRFRMDFTATAANGTHTRFRMDFTATAAIQGGDIQCPGGMLWRKAWHRQSQQQSYYSANLAESG